MADARAIELAAWLRGQVAAGARLTSHSGRVGAGDGFLAYPGLKSDGRSYIDQAIDQGASAVLWEEAGYRWVHGRQVAHQGVVGLRELAGPIAAHFHGNPSHRLDVIAVTGTNGKTSCTHWIAQGLEADGQPSAVIGTLGSGRVGHLDPFGLTTPDAVSLHGMLARFVADGVKAVAMEASSIGLDQGRLAGARIAAAVFTNLTHDHLDYHGSMARYATAKARLFAHPELRVAVVNGDDQACALMLAAVDSAGGRGPRRIGYRLGSPAAPAMAARFQPATSAGDSDAMRASQPGEFRSGGRGSRLAVDGWLFADRMITRADGVTLTVDGDFGRATVPLRVLGRFNVANALAVAATWIGLGMRFDDAMLRLATLEPVPGRLQAIEPDASIAMPLVVVDYAHTPDALANVLGTLRELADARGGRLWCVFGAGGDRDPTKRPVMGRTVEQLADRVVVTSDNPRSESPLKIIADVRAGLTREPELTETDRGHAIAHAIADAGPADVVLIAGKGHEDYQEIEGRRLAFSDATHAREALHRWREAARV